MRNRTSVAGVLLAAALLFAGAAGAYGQESPGPLRMGLLLNFEGDGDRDLRMSFDLAVEHLNAGGGVFGQPVRVVVGNATAEPDEAVAEARRLVREEGVHVLVGPGTSATSIPVAEQVTGPAGVPTISPSATSPQVATVDDRDFLFRTAVSDSAQGPVLARVARDRGFDNVALIYRDDPWGRGMAAAFAAAWTGTEVSGLERGVLVGNGAQIMIVPIDEAQTTYLDALHESAAPGAQALVVVTFASEGVIIVREAVEQGLYERFIFSDALKDLEVPQEVGVEHVAGAYGVSGATDPDSAASAAWEDAFRQRYGELPVLAYVKEIYDAAIALGLAAQAAGSTDGTAIRDRLRAVGSGPGTPVTAGPDGVASALRILAAGGAVDYAGAAATLDWDANGDLRRGHVGVWRFTADGRIEDLDVVPIGYR